MQKEILTPPKVPPATLSQASKWLEEMQYRLNLCIKTHKMFILELSLRLSSRPWMASRSTMEPLVISGTHSTLSINFETLTSLLTESTICSLSSSLSSSWVKSRTRSPRLWQVPQVQVDQQSHLRVTNTSMLVKGRLLPRGKAEEEKEKEAMIIGSLMAANTVITVQGIIQDDNQADARSVDQFDTIYFSMHSSSQAEGQECRVGWHCLARRCRMAGPSWEFEEYEASKGKKGKGKKSKPTGKPKGKSAPRLITPRPAQSQTLRSDRPPKAKPEGRSCVTDDFGSLPLLQWCQPSPSLLGDILPGMALTTWFAQLSSLKRSCRSSSRKVVLVTSKSNYSLWTWCQEHEELHPALRQCRPVRRTRSLMVWGDAVPCGEVCLSGPIIYCSRFRSRPYGSRPRART